MKTLYGIIFLFFLTAVSNAQVKPKFSSQNYAGITEGESGTSFLLQTVNGFRYKTWFAGLGTGLDYYYQRSVPVFLSVNKFFNNAKVPLYFSGDVGVNYSWARDGWYFETAGDYHPGLYWAGGLGYKFGFKKNTNAVLLNLGYNYKRLTQTYERTVMCLVPPCDTYTEKYDYRLKRLAVKVGWMF